MLLFNAISAEKHLFNSYLNITSAEKPSLKFWITKIYIFQCSGFGNGSIGIGINYLVLNETKRYK